MSWEIYLLVVFPNYARAQGGVRLGRVYGWCESLEYVRIWVGKNRRNSGGLRGSLGWVGGVLNSCRGKDGRGNRGSYVHGVLLLTDTRLRGTEGRGVPSGKSELKSLEYIRAA